MVTYIVALLMVPLLVNGMGPILISELTDGLSNTSIEFGRDLMKYFLLLVDYYSDYL